MCSECNWPIPKFNVKSVDGITTIECSKCGQKLIEMKGNSNIVGMGYLSCRNCEEKAYH